MDERALYWYVRARKTTGATVERLSTANGATSKAEAERDMRQFLAHIWRPDEDGDDWTIDEVSRWPLFASPRGSDEGGNARSGLLIP